MGMITFLKITYPLSSTVLPSAYAQPTLARLPAGAIHTRARPLTPPSGTDFPRTDYLLASHTHPLDLWDSPQSYNVLCGRTILLQNPMMTFCVRTYKSIPI